MTIAGMLAERFDGPDAPSQTDAARAFDVSQATVSRWISGRVLPGRDKVPMLAKFLDVREADVIHAVQRQAAQQLASAENRVRAAEAILRLKHAEYRVVEAVRRPTRSQMDALLELGEAINEVQRLLSPAESEPLPSTNDLVTPEYEKAKKRPRKRPGEAARDVG